MNNQEFFILFEDIILNKVKELKEIKELKKFLKKYTLKRIEKPISNCKMYVDVAWKIRYYGIIDENNNEYSYKRTGADALGGFDKALEIMCNLREQEIMSGNIEGHRIERLSDNKKVASKKNSFWKGILIMIIISVIFGIIEGIFR